MANGKRRGGHTALAALLLALLLPACARQAGVQLRYAAPASAAGSAVSTSSAAAAPAASAGAQAGASASSSKPAGTSRAQSAPGSSGGASSVVSPSVSSTIASSAVSAQDALAAYNAAAAAAAQGAVFTYTYTLTGAAAESGGGSATVSGAAFSAVRQTGAGEMDAYSPDGAALWLRWVNNGTAYTTAKQALTDSAAYVPLFVPQLGLDAQPAAARAGAFLNVTAVLPAAPFARALQITAQGRQSETPLSVSLSATVADGAFAALTQTLRYTSGGELTLRLVFMACGAAVRVAAPDYAR